VPALLEVLSENQDQDPVLRHGAVFGLVGAAVSPAQLIEAAKGGTPAVRLGVVLALRRLESPEISQYLVDSEPKVVLEAARAIHDLPLGSELPRLAALVTRSSKDDPLLRRVLNAHFRLGTAENAKAVAEYAARSDAPEAMRIEALAMLKDWEKPSPKDRVLNFWRPLEHRSHDLAVNALKPALPGILTGPNKLRTAAAQLAADFGMKEVGPVLLGLLKDKSQAGQTRADALSALAVLQVPELEATVDQALADSDSRVRAAGRNVLMKLKPSDSLVSFEKAIFEGDTIERQAALASLMDFTQQGTNAILEKALDQLVAGKFPADSRLDLVTAAAKRAAGSIKGKVKAYQSQLPKDDPGAEYLDCTEGGDVERGRKIFFERAQVSCVRCHKAAGTGGDVGPDLTKLTSDPQKTRKYLLDAIVQPNKDIAKGFNSVVILDAEGRVLSGIVKQENDQRVELMTAEGKLTSVEKELIEERKPGKSPMPEDLTKHLTKFELRDLVEYLASLK